MGYDCGMGILPMEGTYTGGQEIGKERGTGVSPVIHGRDAHATHGEGTESWPVTHEQDAHATHGEGTESRDGTRFRYGAYLPHLTRDDGIYFVTFRLADSLPVHVLAQWREERAALEKRNEAMRQPLSKEDQERLAYLFSERVEAHLDAGHGASWIRDPRVAKLVQDALLFFDGVRYTLLCWCVMPNHVHVVVHPHPGFNLSGINHSWKSFTAKEANRVLGHKGDFWQTESYDHLIRNEENLRRRVEYTCYNPDEAGLYDWPWRGMAKELRGEE
jgi:REP element-mobilizing transposase RayT